MRSGAQCIIVMTMIVFTKWKKHLKAEVAVDRLDEARLEPIPIFVASSTHLDSPT